MRQMNTTGHMLSIARTSYSKVMSCHSNVFIDYGKFIENRWCHYKQPPQMMSVNKNNNNNKNDEGSCTTHFWDCPLGVFVQD